MLCEEQRDQCAEYYRICTETFRWTPCMAKPGTEDPYCGNPPEEDTSVTPDIETTQESDTSSDRGLDVSGGTTNESDGTSGEAQPQKVIIVQQAEGGCHPSEGLPPFFSLLSFHSLAVLFSRRTGKSGS